VTAAARPEVEQPLARSKLEAFEFDRQQGLDPFTRVEPAARVGLQLEVVVLG
jgi:hypothetical protein